MLKSNLNYPYPMLRNDSIDYRTSILNCSVDIKVTTDSYVLHVEIETNNDNINQLLEKNILRKCLLVKSNAVWFRKLYDVSNEDIVINSKDIYGKVELLPCIIANERINNFFSEDFEDEYKLSNICIESGEFVAIGEELSFDALLDSDIFKNTSSIFEMIATDENQLSFDMENDKIVIYIPKNIHQNYLNVANSVSSPKSILNSLIVFPILVSILYELKNNPGDEYYFEKKWYKTIMKTIEIKKNNNSMYGLDSSGCIDNPLLVAQSLTNGLITSSFIKLEEILEMGGDE